MCELWVQERPFSPFSPRVPGKMSFHMWAVEIITSVYHAVILDSLPNVLFVELQRGNNE